MKWGPPARFQEEPIVKGPGLALGYLFIVSQHNLRALEKVGCMTANNVTRANFARAVETQLITFPWTVTEGWAPGNTYIRTYTYMSRRGRL